MHIHRSLLARLHHVNLEASKSHVAVLTLVLISREVPNNVGNVNCKVRDAYYLRVSLRVARLVIHTTLLRHHQDLAPQSSSLRSTMGIVTRPRDVTDPFYRSTSTDYTQAYHSIIRAARSGHSNASSSTSCLAAPVLLLVSTDIDAICASRTLVSLLTDDEVPYKVCPVDGYATLSRIVEEDVETNDNVSHPFDAVNLPLMTLTIASFPLQNLAAHYSYAQYGIHTLSTRLFYFCFGPNARRSHSTGTLPYPSH